MENLLFGLGFHTAPYELFFEKEPDYDNIDISKEMLDIIADMANTNICILDFYKHEYFYVSKNHLFICGYTEEKEYPLDQELAGLIIYDEDKDNQLKMKDAACLFFAEHTPAEQLKISLYTNHRLKHKNGNIFMVSNQYKPIKFDDNGKMWMTMCISSIATKNIQVETFIEMNDEQKIRYNYCPKKSKFIEGETQKLSEKEKEILLLASRGFSIKDIADKQNISQSTVKFHRKNILLKLNVESMTEATFYADCHKLLIMK